MWNVLLTCSTWDRISTGWFGYISTSFLVLNKLRSMLHMSFRPRFRTSTIGRLRHSSNSWGEKASSLLLTYTQGVGGDSSSFVRGCSGFVGGSIPRLRLVCVYNEVEMLPSLNPIDSMDLTRSEDDNSILKLSALELPFWVIDTVDCSFGFSLLGFAVVMSWLSLSSFSCFSR